MKGVVGQAVKGGAGLRCRRCWRSLPLVGWAPRSTGKSKESIYWSCSDGAMLRADPGLLACSACAAGGACPRLAGRPWAFFVTIPYGRARRRVLPCLEPLAGRAGAAVAHACTGLAELAWVPSASSVPLMPALPIHRADDSQPPGINQPAAAGAVRPASAAELASSGGDHAAGCPAVMAAQLAADCASKSRAWVVLVRRAKLSVQIAGACAHVSNVLQKFSAASCPCSSLLHGCCASNTSTATWHQRLRDAAR